MWAWSAREGKFLETDSVEVTPPLIDIIDIEKLDSTYVLPHEVALAIEWAHLGGD